MGNSAGSEVAHPPTAADTFGLEIDYIILDCKITYSSSADKKSKSFFDVTAEGLGFESPSGRDIFCLKNFAAFTRTPVRVSKMNAVARTQC